MDNAPKTVVLIVLALVIGAVFVPASKSYGTNSMNKVNEQTNALFDTIGN